MPEWLSGLLVGVVLTLAAQYAQRVRFRYERLVNLYAQFVATVSQEIERARMADAAIVFSKTGSEDSYNAHWRDLEQRRHRLRGGMLRLAFEIRLLEWDDKLRRSVDELAGNQVFLWGDEEDWCERGQRIAERRERKGGIDDYERALRELCDAVSARRVGPVWRRVRLRSLWRRRSV